MLLRDGCSEQGPWMRSWQPPLPLPHFTPLNINNLFVNLTVTLAPLWEHSAGMDEPAFIAPFPALGRSSPGSTEPRGAERSRKSQREGRHPRDTRLSPAAVTPGSTHSFPTAALSHGQNSIVLQSNAHFPPQLLLLISPLPSSNKSKEPAHGDHSSVPPGVAESPTKPLMAVNSDWNDPV